MSTIKSAVIKQQDTFSVCLEIKGTASYLQNKFSQKAIEEMLRKHMGLSNVREKKIPSECVERATIKNAAEVVCIPPTAIKKAMLTASANIKGLKKTQLRSSVFIEGGSIPIKYSQMIPQMDMVRTSGMGRTPDVRFRPRFEDWSARLIILFSEMIPVQTVVDLLHRSGNVGIGEWRPEKDGTYGTFVVSRSIEDSKEVAEVRNACKPIIPPLTIPEWALNAELTPEILARIGAGKDDDDGDDK
jgi:hypothetical protein